MIRYGFEVIIPPKAGECKGERKNKAFCIRKASGLTERTLCRFLLSLGGSPQLPLYVTNKPRRLSHSTVFSVSEREFACGAGRKEHLSDTPCALRMHPCDIGTLRVPIFHLCVEREVPGTQSVPERAPPGPTTRRDRATARHAPVPGPDFGGVSPMKCL